jgi:hypothetical protein
MKLKSAIFAAVAAAATLGLGPMASAAPVGAAAALGVQNGSDLVQNVSWRPHTRTVVRCVHGRRVLMRINWRGRVVSRRVIGYCWHPHKHHHHHHKHHKH